MGKRTNPFAKRVGRAVSVDVAQEAALDNWLRVNVLGRRVIQQIGVWFFSARSVALLLGIGVGWFVQASAVGEPLVVQQNSADSRVTPEMPATSGSAAAVEEGKKDEPDPNAYIIGEQDSLVITVWKEKELSGGVVVRPDGKITVPLVGEVKVVGMTPVQLQSLLAEKLKPFVTVPQVTVAVAEIRSRKVYLIGHTGREGPFMINSSTTVLQIIAQAGGLKDFAKRKKIYILRKHGQEQVRFSFNYDDVIKGKHTEQNILLEPGDTIVVP
jgi:polysaccharide export outer membrane protein